MEFIGIGFLKADGVSFELVRERAAAHDLLASKTIGEGNFREGLAHFASYLDLDVVQFAAFNDDDKTASSRQISAELMAFQRSATETGFLQFLEDETTCLPRTFYLVAACDWSEGSPVRLEKVSVKHLKDYFRSHSSWYLWLYNYSAKRYHPRLDLPLILEISNDGAG